jgi:hypothetical protein
VQLDLALVVPGDDDGVLQGDQVFLRQASERGDNVVSSALVRIGDCHECAHAFDPARRVGGPASPAADDAAATAARTLG